MKRSLLATALVLVVGTFSASANETILIKATLDKVPPPAMEAVKKALPGFEAQSVLRGKMGNQVSFELDGKVAGKTAEVVVTLEAKVVESEVDIELDDVPQPIINAATKAVPGLVVEKAMKGTRGTVSFFDLSGKANNKEYSVEVTTEGKVLETDEAIDLKDVPKVVTDAAARLVQGFKADSAKKLTMTMPASVAYELTGKVDGFDCEIKVSPEGKVLDIQREAEPEERKPGTQPPGPAGRRGGHGGH